MVNELYTQGYVLGFAFNPASDSVLLIKKVRPDWQAGLYNGVGGKIEPDEDHSDAMQREFYEETGILTRADSWKRFAQHLCPKSQGTPGYLMHLYTTTVDANPAQTTDEVPCWFQLSGHQYLVRSGVPGCHMYIAMALHLRDKPYTTTTLEIPDTFL